MTEEFPHPSRNKCSELSNIDEFYVRWEGAKMLGVHMQTTVKTLFEKGYSKTKIGEILSIDRKTVRKILKTQIRMYISRRNLTHQYWTSTESSSKSAFLKSSQQHEFIRIYKKKVLKGRTQRSGIMYESLKSANRKRTW
jgi:hypothetical protein